MYVRILSLHLRVMNTVNFLTLNWLTPVKVLKHDLQKYVLSFIYILRHSFTHICTLSSNILLLNKSLSNVKHLFFCRKKKTSKSKLNLSVNNCPLNCGCIMPLISFRISSPYYSLHNHQNALVICNSSYATGWYNVRTVWTLQWNSSPKRIFLNLMASLLHSAFYHIC